jgi:C4-dicarboxylate-specific signal transduction histidine kinase
MRAACRGARRRAGAGYGPRRRRLARQAQGEAGDREPARQAVDASPPGSRVDVEATTGDGRVRISVRDRGPGVSPAIRDRLFTPFATTKADGIGLGLTLARELVHAHGGTLEWQPAEEGAVFVVLLPRAG